MKKIFLILLFFPILGYSQIGTTDTGYGYGCNLGNRIYSVWLGYKETYNATDKRAYYDENSTYYDINWDNNATSANCKQTNNNTLITMHSSCVITSNYNGKVITGNGTIYKFTPICNLPLDDHIHLIVLAAAGLGVFYLRKNGKLAF